MLSASVSVPSPLASTSRKYLECLEAGTPNPTAISDQALSNSAAVTRPSPSESPVVVKAFNSVASTPFSPSSSKNKKIGSKSTPVAVSFAAWDPATANKTSIKDCIIFFSLRRFFLTATKKSEGFFYRRFFGLEWRGGAVPC